MRIGVVGKKNFVIGFQLCGIRDIFISNEGDFQQKFEECFGLKNISIIIAEGAEFEALPAYIKKRVEKTLMPLVVPLSEERQGTSDMRRLIKRCLGVDIWSR